MGVIFIFFILKKPDFTSTFSIQNSKSNILGTLTRQKKGIQVEFVRSGMYR